MAMTQFSPALLSLMEVAKKVTPQGQQTVAQRTIEDALATEAPQPSAPPQQGLPGVLAQTQQAAPMVAENMANADAVKNAQRLAQAQPQPPAMMAEGGIASLPMGDEDYEYADGGIIGYAGGGTSDVGDEGSIIRRLIDWMKSSKKEEAEPEPQPMVPMIPNKGLEQAAAAEPDKPASYGFPERSYMEAALRQAPPAARPAQRPGVGIEQALPPAAKEPTFTGAAEEAMGVFKRPDDTRLRAEGERLRELQTQRPTSAAEIKANEIAREKQRAQYEEISGRDTGLGELMSVLGGISRRTGPLAELEGYRTKRDTATAKETEAARLFAQQQSLLEKKDYADKIGDIKASMEIEQALIKNQEEYNKAMIPASASAYSTKAQQVSSAADRAARAKENAANIAARAKEAELSREAGRQIDPTTAMLFDANLAVAKKEGKDPTDPAVRRDAMISAIEGKGGAAKSTLGWFNTTLQKELADWGKTMEGQIASEEDKAAKVQEITARLRAQAEAAGRPVPEGAGTNPLGGISAPPPGAVRLVSPR